MCTTGTLDCDDAARLVDELEELRRQEAALAARRVEVTDALRRSNIAHEHQIVHRADNTTERAEFVERCTRAQVACALRVTERRARQLIEESRMLVTDLTATLEALRTGDLSYRHAAVLVDESCVVSDQARTHFEAAVLSGRRDVPAETFAKRCRRIREHVHPETIERRATAAERKRCVTVDHGRDGMAWLTAYLPIMQAELAHTLLTGLAMDERDAGDPRTLDQLRADALLDCLLRSGRPAGVADGADPSAALRSIRVGVSITVPALSILGLSDEPAILDGYGPIPMDTAKVLAAAASSWRRILTDPATGVRLTYDRETYRVPAELRAWLQDRDGTCRFPGCGRRARGCDVDHNHAWESGGCTDHDNLSHLCRAHHRLKHHTSWWARFEDELMVWTDPTGHEYASGPREDRAPPPRPGSA